MSRFGAGIKMQRHVGRQHSNPSGQFYVPADIFRMVPPDARFTIELTPDGILYRRVPPPPKWTQAAPEGPNGQ